MRSPFFFGRTPTPKLPIERQTFGGTLGGPIRRDQLFFFGSYQGYLGRQELFTFFNVPSAAIRNGDFSSALNANGTLQRIYDPLSGDLATGTGRVQFENNIIPAGRINAISKRLSDLYPLPNVEGTGAGGFTSNYRTARHANTDRHNYDAKVNWNRTPAHQLWGKYSHMNAVVDDLFNFPLGSSDSDGCDTKVHLITGGQTWSFGRSLLLDSAVGVSMMDQFCSSSDFELGNLGLDYGIPGTNDQGRSDPRYAGMPEFRTGFQALGNSPTWTPTYRDEGTTSISSNVTKIKSNHEFRFGYRLDYLHLDNWQPERANPRGRFDFATNSTRTFGTGSQGGNFYNQYAAFLLGLVGTARKSYQYELFTGREWQHAMYVRDRWNVNQKITLDLGVRWEYYPIMTRADRQIEMMDRNTLDVLIGGVGGNPKNMGLVAPKDSFAPRIGGVYRLNNETVFRSGYGATLDARGMSAQEAFRGDFSYPLVLNGLFQPVAGTSSFGWYGTVNQGIPLLVGPDLSTGSHAPAERLRDADGGAGIDAPRTHALLERVRRAAYSVQCVGRRRVCRQQVGRRPAARGNADHQHQQRPAHRRWRHGSPVLPNVRTSGRHRDLLAMAQDELSRAADRRDAAVHAGVDAEGPLHVEPVESAASRL